MKTKKTHFISNLNVLKKKCKKENFLNKKSTIKQDKLTFYFFYLFSNYAKQQIALKKKNKIKYLTNSK